MKIYTKNGDGGITSLAGGKRVSKNHPRVEAYGSIDELMAHTAYFMDNMSGDESLKDFCEDLRAVLQSLMDISAVFATENDAFRDAAAGGNYAEALGEALKHLEQRIDCISAGLTPVDKFTIPGGHPLVSLSHIARTVCRRAERCAVRIESTAPAHIVSLQYINRLSDYLYILGRRISQEFNVCETLWIGK